MLTKLIRVAVFALAVISTTEALADCYLNGKRYPNGTVLGKYQCSGGSWRRP